MKKVLLAIALLFTFICNAFSQEKLDFIDDANSVLQPPTMGVLGGPTGQGIGVVGSIEGAVEVGGLGSATYSIPIETPSGICNMQPGISITYNSQSSNGVLGWGWTLGGLSAIMRVNKTLYLDGELGGVDFGNDRFALDGQRLLSVGSNTYGTDGAEYRTEVDGMGKIVSYTESGIVNGPAKFKVWTADGHIMEYGYTEDSRMAHEVEDGSPDREVGLWLLNKVEDRDGNYVEYHYVIGDANYYISYIKYTGNASLSVTPCYTVYFEYQSESRRDEETTFVGNYALHQGKLLQAISIKWWDDEVARYDFSYHGISVGRGYPYYRLKEITHSKEGVSYNPTVINWGPNDYILAPSQLKTSVAISPDNSAFNNMVKMTGDFNGDGMSDVLVAFAQAGNKYAAVYLNQGMVMDNGVEKCSFTHYQTLELDSFTVSLQVADFNGDGRDDMVGVSSWNHGLTKRLRIWPFLTKWRNNRWELDYAEKGWNDEDGFPIGLKGGTNMLIGDFLGRGKTEMMMQIKGNLVDSRLLYITYSGDNRFDLTDQPGSVIPGKAFVAADFNGDGITEIWCNDSEIDTDNDKAQDETRSIASIYKMTSQRTAVQFNTDHVYTSGHTIMTGDFNGDGHADILSYEKVSSIPKRYVWKINLFKENDLYYPYFDITDNLPINDPGERDFDLFGSPSSHDDFQYFEIMDMNGDGKSDFVVERNGCLCVLYGPVIINGNGDAVFSDQQTFDLDDIGLGNLVSTMTLCHGNFLGKENVAILGNYQLFSPKPMTGQYSVASIVDGMGNTTAFEYDYLTCLNSTIYQRNKTNDLPGLDIYTMPLSLKAVKSISCQNPMAGTPVATTCYHYADAYMHKKGHGMLGFRKTITTSFINNVRQDSTIVVQSVDGVEEHRTLAMKSQRVYNALDRLVMSLDCTNDFMESSANPLVYVPLITSKSTMSFSPDDDDNTMLSKGITDNVYRIDVPSDDGGLGRYANTLKLTDTYEGVTDYRWAEHAMECRRVVHTRTVFQPDQYLADWIINRPDTTIVTSWQYGDNALSKSLIVYTYLNNTSYHPLSVTSYPGGDVGNANEFATSTTYGYDLAGNVTSDTLKALCGSPSPRVNTYVYENYRFKTSETNTLGYETINRYNIKYGEIKESLDCNGITTYYNRSDHLGTTDWVMYPDGTYGCTAKRWVKDEDEIVYDSDAPEKSAYYTWKRISGELPVKVFYDAAGREMRTVSYSLYGDTIYQDTEYNGMGLKSRSSLPYFHGETPLWTSFNYDGFLRPLDTYMPDGTRLHYDYDGLSTTSTFVATTGETRSSTEIGNYFGKKAKSIDDNGTEVRYTYYHNGMLKWTQIGDNTNTRISMVYDDAGNRIRLLDPNYGEIVEVYDAFGQLLSTTSPKGDMTRYRYDVLGRIETRKETDEVHHTTTETSWEYYETVGKKGLLKQVCYGNDQTITYNYDASHLNRLVSKTERLFGIDYQTSYTYDDVSGFPLRVKTTTYPTGYSTQNVYHLTSGKLYRINDGLGAKLWETENVNAMGQVTQYGLGANITSMRGYQPETGRLTSIYSYNNNAELQNLGYGYDDFGNLSYRCDKARNLREDFGYDNLDRLDSIALNNQIVSRITYDPLGRMISKQADGHDVFAAAQYDYVGPDNQLRPHAISSATVTGNPFPNGQLNIDYTMFDKVQCIYRTPNNLNFDYGYDRQRIRMHDGAAYEKIYVGGCEFVSDASGGKVWTYLVGPMGVFGVAQTMGGLTKVHYVLKDHLGSWTTITNSAGVVEQERSFDAWGLMRNPDTWREYTGDLSMTLMFDRGYTGHEHLLAVGLINMNGRVYDPVMSSFLSVDTYVQDPDNAQNFNRYAYCLNNPLKYTDPSGEFGILAAMAVGAAISMVSTMASNYVYDRPIAEGLGRAAVVGALQGAFSLGIGAAANMIGNTAGRVAFQMAAHGILGGVSTSARGGKFWQGFATGAVSSLISSGIEGLCLHYKVPEAWTKAAIVAAGTLSGGVTATMAGGSFWEGVCNGLICAGLNHAMHVTIFYGKGLMIASITGQKRHIIGPDAIAGAITLDASGGVAMSAEGGGILVLVGDEKGFYSYSDLGIGGGLVTVSVGVELVELYSSSPDSEVSLSDFIGSRWELNASLAAYSVNVGITALYGKHSVNDSNGRTGFTIGFGGNVGLDAIPFRFNGNINYGATQVGSNSRLKDELKKAFNITRK